MPHIYVGSEIATPYFLGARNAIAPRYSLSLTYLFTYLLLCGQEEGISDVNEMLQSERPLADRRLRDVLSDLGTACSRYLTLNQSRTGATSGRTRLDVERLKMCQREIVCVSVYTPSTK